MTQVYEYIIIGVIVIVCGFITNTCSILAMWGVMYICMKIRNFRERNIFRVMINEEEEEEEEGGGAHPQN